SDGDFGLLAGLARRAHVNAGRKALHEILHHWLRLHTEIIDIYGRDRARDVSPSLFAVRDGDDLIELNRLFGKLTIDYRDLTIDDRDAAGDSRCEANECSLNIVRAGGHTWNRIPTACIGGGTLLRSEDHHIDARKRFTAQAVR